MARRCDLCGRGPGTTYAVSHAHNRTKRWVYLNLQRVTLRRNGRAQRLSVCTHCQRSTLRKSRLRSSGTAD